MQINILVVVNVAKALNEGTLSNNLWMCDTNPNNMSQYEGQAELETACAVGDEIVWTVTSIDPDLPVSINSFNGVALNSAVIAPYSIDPEKNQQWKSKVVGVTHANGDTNDQVKQKGQYSMILAFGKGRTMPFDPYIDSQA